MRYSERMPLGLRISLMAGTTTWELIPRSERFYYETGGARGGKLEDDGGDGVNLSAGESVTLSEGDYDRAVEMYCTALDEARLRSGLSPFRYDSADDVPDTVPNMGNLPTAPVSPAAPRAGALAVNEAALMPSFVDQAGVLAARQ